MVGVNNVNNSSFLQQIQTQQNKLQEQLATGRRINSAADGAAAQQIIERLTSQINGSSQAFSNAFDAISVVQTADSGLSGINEDVARIRELALQSGSGILNDSDRQAIQEEITQLQDNISQTIEQTNFAGQPLLDNDGEISFSVSGNGTDQISVNTQDFNSLLGDVLSVNVTTQDLEDVLQATDDATQNIGSARSELGATQNRLDSTIRNLTQSNINLSASRSRIADTDFAQSASDLISSNVLNQSATFVQGQANLLQGQVLSLLS